MNHLGYEASILLVPHGGMQFSAGRTLLVIGKCHWVVVYTLALEAEAASYSTYRNFGGEWDGKETVYLVFSASTYPFA